MRPFVLVIGLNFAASESCGDAYDGGTSFLTSVDLKYVGSTEVHLNPLPVSPRVLSSFRGCWR